MFTPETPGSTPKSHTSRSVTRVPSANKLELPVPEFRKVTSMMFSVLVEPGLYDVERQPGVTLLEMTWNKA